MVGKRSVRAIGLSVAVLLLLVMLSITYIHERYFFNPLTFRKNDFLYQSWNTYKEPLSMEVFNAGGSNAVKTVKDANQVRRVINEIEQTSNKQVSPPKQFSGPTYGIFFHTGDILFQQVLIYPDDKILQFVAQTQNSQGLVQKPKYEPLSPELLRYVTQQLGMSHS